MNEIVCNNQSINQSINQKEYFRNWRLKNREHVLEYHRNWYHQHKNIVDKYYKYGKTWRQKLKLEVLKHYSPDLRCSRCGYGDIRALSIDHINGGGLRHIKQLGGGGSNLYHWLRKQGYPSGFQVLCMNCQWIKRNENGEVRKVARS